MKKIGDIYYYSSYSFTIKMVKLNEILKLAYSQNKKKKLLKKYVQFFHSVYIMPFELSEKKNVQITSIRSNDKTQTFFFECDNILER